MCGIVATMPSSPSLVKEAVNKMRDRGPDEQFSISISNEVSIGISRLAISDLTHGVQPMLRSRNTLLLAFNGAIYNFEQLRKQLQVDLPSMNDGEIIVPLYEKFGLDFAGYLEGMFAILIFDCKNNKLVAAVDHLGIKPLYFAQDKDRLMFASVPDVFPDELRKEVQRHPPGYAITSKNEWHKYDISDWDGSEKASDLKQALEESVASQIPKEVPWGCLLSGGIDSSIIAMQCKLIDGHVKTISCGLENSSDREFAKRLANYHDFEHYDVQIEADQLPQLAREVVKVTGSYDPYVILSGIGTYVASQKAKELQLKVLLCGEGADELFGGYADYQDIPIAFLKDKMILEQYGLGATECFRLDRCAMACSIEARVPFLSRSVIKFARSLPESELIQNTDRQVITKVALRRVAEELLPDFISGRPKVRFFDGAGIPKTLTKMIDGRRRSKQISTSVMGPDFYGKEVITPWLIDVWKEIFGREPDDWTDLMHRGLVRQRHTKYLPISKF